MFWFVKTVLLYSAGPESKIGLSYYVNVVCLYGVRGGGGVRGFKMFCQRGSEFFLLALCVSVGGVQVQYLSFREKITDPPPVNK